MRQPHEPLRLNLSKEPYRNLTRTQRWRIQFWAWVCDRAEARWLEANGWVQKTPGWWLLPEWHPKKNMAQERAKGRRKHMRFDDITRIDPKPIREPYDQNHAANSQRYYVRTVQTTRTTRHKVPAFPSYVRWKPYLWTASACANVLGVGGLASRGHWVSDLFFLAAALSICVSLRIAYACRHGAELDYVEERLGRAHDRDSIGG